MSLLLTSGEVQAVDWSGVAASASGASTPQTATVEFLTNGSLTATGQPAARWYSAIVTGIGNDFEIYAELISGTGVTGDFTTWLALSSLRSWSLSSSTVGFTSAVVRYSIRKAGEVAIMNVDDINFDVEVTA